MWRGSGIIVGAAGTSHPLLILACAFYMAPLSGSGGTLTGQYLKRESQIKMTDRSATGKCLREYLIRFQAVLGVELLVGSNPSTCTSNHSVVPFIVGTRR